MTGTGWTDPTWLAVARTWIEAELARTGRAITGPVEQPHARPWATVLRVPTVDGAVFFKANAPSLRHEAAVVGYLAERHPDFVPRPIAVNVERGWILMEDAGVRLRELVAAERDVGRWRDVLPLYAGLQLALAPAVDDLLALGVPDRRLATLPRSYAVLLDELERTEDPTVAVSADEIRRLRDAADGVEAGASELATFGIPETIQHDDLNDGQVFLREGEYRLLDWADACVSHPFFSLSVTLEGVIQWGVDDVQGSVDTAPFRDAYLEPFAREWPRRDLLRAVEVALRLGWVCRAVNGRVPGVPDAGATGARLRMFLDGRP